MKRYATSLPEPSKMEADAKSFIIQEERLHVERDIRKASGNRKEICSGTKLFHEIMLLGTVYQVYGWVWLCTVSCNVTQFGKVDTPHP